jgi:branched-chain amino acid transport system ATP-binding protein
MLDVRSLSMRFDGLEALSDVSLTVEQGSLVGLIGPNGAGKTTLVNCLTGMLRATGGTATWRGTDLVGPRPDQLAARGVARTFQHSRLFPELTVIDNVMVGAHRLGTTGAFAAALRLPRRRREDARLREIAAQALAAVHCEPLTDRFASELTAGQQRLVAVARALAGEPELLFLDEPAAGLNDAETSQLEHDLRTLQEERGVTMVVIEHHLGFVMSISSTVIVLAEGRMLAHGTPGSIQADPSVITAYIGAR